MTSKEDRQFDKDLAKELKKAGLEPNKKGIQKLREDVKKKLT